MSRETLISLFWSNHDKLQKLEPDSKEYIEILFKNRVIVDKIVGMSE